MLKQTAIGSFFVSLAEAPDGAKLEYEAIEKKVLTVSI
jgi:hypothetical protein